MKKALFIDFDDSITWNVIQELETANFSVSVLHWMDLDETVPETDLLVLGPGPGHPDDYQTIFPVLTDWIEKKRPVFGLCLGHQILWRLRGEMVYRSKEPVHGHRVELTLDKNWQEFLSLPPKVKVQRYNALSVAGEVSIRNPDVRNVLLEGEVMISRGEHFLSYQFHPESVGTSFRQAFFRPLQTFFV
jgi:anthranilate/para-aminobenzoate synthase component II